MYNADFAANFTARTLFAGAWNLGNATRTVSSTRVVTAAQAVAGGGNTAWGLGLASTTVIPTVSNGTLSVARDSGLSSNYVSFRIADNPAFIGNAGLTIGNAVVATVGNANLSNADKTKLMTLTVNAGGYFTTGETANQRDVEISSLSGGGTVGNFVTANSTVTSTLTINGGALTSSTTFSGAIVDTDSTTFTGSTNGKIALVKTGSNTQILSGTNTYTGNTTVSAGTLLINGSTGASQFTVNGSGILGGNGTIGGSVTIASGGTLSAGVKFVL